MPSFNFSASNVNNATYHHSRLMGVSDVENTVRSSGRLKIYAPNCLSIQDALFFQDSLLDVITSLGAEEEKIILSGSAMGNKFNLLDAHRNTPGSASVGASTAVTYQQARKPILPIYNGQWCTDLVDTDSTATEF